MEKSKALLRAQFYGTEAKKIRDSAANEVDQKRREILLEIAQSYQELYKQIIAEVKAGQSK